MTSNRLTETQLEFVFLQEADSTRATPEPQRGQSALAAMKQTTWSDVPDSLMEQIVDSANMERAWKKVKANRGAPGLDGVTLDEFFRTFRDKWPTVRQQLLDGTYQPEPARRKSIPKPDGRAPTRSVGRASFGHSQCPRKIASASHPSSSDTDLRSGLFRIELRFPTKALRSAGSAASASSHSGRLSSLRRYGPVEIFRPSTARCLNDTRCSQGSRQAIAMPDWKILASGCDGRCSTATLDRRDDARGPAFTHPSQHPTG